MDYYGTYGSEQGSEREIEKNEKYIKHDNPTTSHLKGDILDASNKQLFCPLVIETRNTQLDSLRLYSAVSRVIAAFLFFAINHVIILSYLNN